MKTASAIWLGCSVAILVSASLSAEPKKAGPPKKNAEAQEAHRPVLDISGGVLAGESPATVKIEKALGEPTEMEFIEAPLTDVIDYLKHRHMIEIQLDNKALEESGVATDTQIAHKLKGISLRSALQLVLRDIELTYVIRDEVLLITSAANAETILEVRIYAVGDLLHAHGQPIGSRSLAEQLKEVIASTVAPNTWAEVGGAGSIQYWPGNESLVIGQTYAVHQELHDFFTALRTSRGLQLSGPAEQPTGEQSDRLYVAVYRLPYHVRVMLQMESRFSPATKSDKPGQPAPGGGTRVSPSREVIEGLAQAIPKLVDPKSWKAKADEKGPLLDSAGGGKGGASQGAIEIVGNDLIILQTAKVHQQIGQFLQVFAATNEMTSGF
jgi:hypothetical protein